MARAPSLSRWARPGREVLVDYYPGCRVIVPTPEGDRSVLATDLLPGAYRLPNVVAASDQRPELMFSARYLDAVQSGAKTRTTRRRQEVARGPVCLVFATDPRTRLDATVLAVRQTTLAALSADDARAEQCESVEDLK